MRNSVVLFLLSAGFIVFCSFGCSSKNPPLQDISNAKMALLEAKEAGASSLAPDLFNQSQAEYKKMQEFMDKEEFKQAKYAAQKAYIKAKSALSHAQNEKVQKRVDELNSEVNVIKKDFTTISK